MSDTISSYPKVYNIGHPALGDLIANPDVIVTVEEKLDGSQFSFGVERTYGHLTMRSKGAVIDPAEPPKLFQRAVDGVKAAYEAGRLTPGVIYRGEAICSKRHNSLTYDRFPENGVILFDAEITDETGQTRLARRPELEGLAQEAGFEVVRCHRVCSLRDLFGTDMTAALESLLAVPSMLGGPYAEGFVLKAHDLFGRDGKFLAAKYVRPEFRELHAATWPTNQNPDRGWERGLATAVVLKVNVPARWVKAVQGAEGLEGSMCDIPALMKYVSEDAHDEVMPVLEEMARRAWKDVSKALTRGLPEWYNDRLLQKQAALYAAHATLEDVPTIPLEQLAAERAEAMEGER